jgi:transposase
MERLSMRKIREVLRLRYEVGLSARQVAASVQMARSSVGEYERRLAAAGLSWPLPKGLSDTELERRLLSPPPLVPADTRPVPDWSMVHEELRQPGVTLILLWEEYRTAHPEGFAYIWFCDRYRAWAAKLDLVMRQTHRAGEKLFVDYAGQTIEVIDRHTGEVCTAELFVAVLGASKYTYAEASWTQALPDWIGAHVRAFQFLGGVSEVVVPDNLRSGVNKAHRYEPDLNPTYQELARHYNVAVAPARVRRARDKAKVEQGVCWSKAGSWPVFAIAPSSR